eukprot:3225418-Ditylum_brightwellii.AAC.1
METGLKSGLANRNRNRIEIRIGYARLIEFSRSIENRIGSIMETGLKSGLANRNGNRIEIRISYA